MEKNKTEMSETMQKIVKGLELVSKKLIETTKKNNGELVVMEGDKIKFLKAKDL